MKEYCVRIGVNYAREEHRYNFSGLKFPTPFADIKHFECTSPGTSVNVYGLKHKAIRRTITHSVYPLRGESKPL